MWEGECNGRILDLKIFRGGLPKKVKKVKECDLSLSFHLNPTIQITIRYHD